MAIVAKGMVTMEVILREWKTKRVHTSFTRKYDPHIEFGFIAIIDGEVLKPQCIICGDVLANEAK